MFKSSVKSITSSTILTLLIGCSSTETNKNIVYKVGGDSIILNKYCILKMYPSQSEKGLLNAARPFPVFYGRQLSVRKLTH
ncbi:Uncharacterised protein [Shigella sonnei]|nr:Uncharacterised protein [Shigella sonnei]